VSGPPAPDFIRYLAAKQPLDDRSLNRQVWDTLMQAVRDRPNPAPLKVLEVGCGIGTMLERLLDWVCSPGGVYRHRCRGGVHPGGPAALPPVCGGAPGRPVGGR